MEPSDRAFRLTRRAVLPVAALAALPTRLALAQTTPAETAPSVEPALGKLDAVVQDAMRRTGVPGVAVAVVYRDRALYLKGFGVRWAGRPDPVDADTVFPLASVSKPIASTVVAALVGDGLVAWSDPIIRHDPAFQMYDAWVTRQVTLSDMFAHRSGLPDHAGDALEDIGYDRGEILYRLRYQKPDSSFRAHYAYTNFGLTAAAVAAARASGKAWEDVSAERIYRRIGMIHTSSRFADFTATTNRVHSHVRQGDAWVAKYTREPDAQSPAGGVTASVGDMVPWMRLQLGRGMLDGEQVVKPDGLDETHRPQVIRTPPVKDPMTGHASFYGLGWNVDYDDHGRIHWSHSGAFDLGAATSVTLLPTEQLGITVLTNAQPIGVPEAIIRSFLDLVLTGSVQKDWVTLYGQLMTAALAPNYGPTVDYNEIPPGASPALPNASYVGTYDNDLSGPIGIETAPQGGLVLTLGPKPLAFPLRHFDRDVFTYQPTGENAYGRSAVAFTIGADGKAVDVTIENLDIDHQGTFTRRTSE
ncbi:MAG: serine hydrolase [Acetobacteraceae bacterium]